MTQHNLTDSEKVLFQQIIETLRTSLSISKDDVIDELARKNVRTFEKLLCIKPSNLLSDYLETAGLWWHLFQLDFPNSESARALYSIEGDPSNLKNAPLDIGLLLYKMQAFHQIGKVFVERASQFKFIMIVSPTDALDTFVGLSLTPSFFPSLHKSYIPLQFSLDMDNQWTFKAISVEKRSWNVSVDDNCLYGTIYVIPVDKWNENQIDKRDMTLLTHLKIFWNELCIKKSSVGVSAWNYEIIANTQYRHADIHLFMERQQIQYGLDRTQHVSIGAFKTNNPDGVEGIYSLVLDSNIIDRRKKFLTTLLKPLTESPVTVLLAQQDTSELFHPLLLHTLENDIIKKIATEKFNKIMPIHEKAGWIEGVEQEKFDSYVFFANEQKVDGYTAHVLNINQVDHVWLWNRKLNAPCCDHLLVKEKWLNWINTFDEKMPTNRLCMYCKPKEG